MRQMGFFTDTTLCIGCKACEVACKQWNQLSDDGFLFTGMSFDNTRQLGASTWRHVAFVERPAALPGQGCPRAHEGVTGRDGIILGQPHPLNVPMEMLEESRVDVLVGLGGPPEAAAPPGSKFAWLMLSDVCKHCERAGCLEACPTGSIVRTEFGSVYVQPDICNGCGYCVSACPFGVIDRREDDGRAWKCTLCYDRLKGDMVPACAKACPTASIQFGPVDQLQERARERVETLHERGVADAYLYGESAASQPGTEGLHAFFLLCDRPEVYNLPPDPVVPTKKIADAWWAMAASVVGLAALALGSVLGARRSLP
ncbi:MAG TPA: 4Fe-4S dicluster domain-containing protein [Anaeromyxobacteraceae bacterium]